MTIIIFVILGMVGGGFCVFIALDRMRRDITAQRKAIEESVLRVKEAWRRVEERQKETDTATQRLQQSTADFDARVVSYAELEQENVIVKRDLQNLDIHVRKLQLDHELMGKSQHEIDERSNELASLYLKDNVKWIGSNLNPNNFAASKQRLQKVIERCRGIGFQVSPAEEEQLFVDLREEYQRVVRAAFEREEQARIRAQIREEQQREREIQRELQQLEREREAIAAALERALAETHDEHSAEVESLRARLAEAEERTQRTISQAQLTKAGHVYVISNIGAFGEGVFKIGMTRRLEPLDRVVELSGAAVPFPFDVHMMITCNDAPGLENALHRKLHTTRINKTNPRKEFFKTTLDSVAEVVRQHHGEVTYVVDAEALQYRQSLSMSDDDQEFIKGIYGELEDEAELAIDE